MSSLAEARRTGSRARGTRLHELWDLYEGGISAKAIFEDLECRRPEDSATEIAAYMDEQSFDVMGVQPEGRAPVGFVRREKLNSGRCGDHLERFVSRNLIADSTPLVNVLSTLKDRSYVFVLSREEVSGIVTRADLQKPPVRMYLFGLVTLLEMHMGALIRRFYQGETWMSELGESRVEYAREFQEKRRKRNEELSLLDCLQFCDKRDLIIEHERTREVLGISSKTQGQKLLRSAEKLRDNLSHAQKLAEGSGWTDTIELVVQVEDLIQRSEEVF